MVDSLAKIEITPEMVETGAKALAVLGVRFEVGDEIIEDIFTAMITAKNDDEVVRRYECRR